MNDDLWSGDDDFDDLPAGGLAVVTESATSSAPTSLPNRAPASDRQGRRVGDDPNEIVDDGVTYGIDPDFAEAVAPTLGATFDFPSGADILDPPRSRTSKSASRPSRAAATDQDTDVEPEPEVSSRDARRMQREEKAAARQRDRDAAKEARKERIAARKERRNGSADDTAPRGEKSRRRNKWVPVILVALVVAVGAVAYFSLFSRSSVDAGGSGPAQSTTSAAAAAPTFAAGAGCVPGAAAQGMTVADATSSTDTTTAVGAINAMENAYYMQRSGTAVASYMGPALKPDPAKIQSALDGYIPAGTNVAYCMQVGAADAGNVHDVQIIESRNGTEFARTHQQITVVKQTDGTYQITWVHKV